LTPFLLLLVAFLAYANGANDNSKGVATLVGYGAARPLQALIYAAITTAIGAAVSFWFSGGLLKSFSTGLFATGTPITSAFFICVLIGAFGWVIIATFTGLPVSTTHAITGSLIGAGLVAMGRDKIQWSTLNTGFVRPLLLGPIISLVAVYLLAWPVVFLVRQLAPQRELVTSETATVTSISANSSSAPSGVVLDYQSSTETKPVSPTANVIHWLSAGLIGFARGWNDTPKIAALALIVVPSKMSLPFTLVAIAMAIGGLISARRVLDTLARKLTPLPLPESLTASFTTAALVCLASWKGLPVSTTHVSTGAIIGAGLKNNLRQVKWKKVTEILLSWIITLPAAAILAAVAKLLIN
jgi:PiT family inorganic phosphate transporter